MIKKVKIRDLTEEQQKNFCDEKHHFCKDCPFALKGLSGRIVCCARYLARNQLSDQFLDQEVEVEVPDILTRDEHDYLEAVIEPFKGKVIGIYKGFLDFGCEYIAIIYEDHLDKKSVIPFPSFQKNGAYRGMKTNQEYTLEDLGL